MREYSDKFAALFKKYRLKAEFPTLTQFGTALADKGYIYEDSIFSHWQKGTRIPQSRSLLLSILAIFVEKKAITALSQANELLVSARAGSLSDEEINTLPFQLHTPIFQAPNEISDFIDREEIIKNLTSDEDLRGRVILIYGAAGVGKTALAIHLAHLLDEKYTDGILWYKVEEDNLMDILQSIANIFGEDISTISDMQVRATIVRSLLSGKNTLLFLDSAELCDDIHILIPHSQYCTVIITSQKNTLKVPTPHIGITLTSFTTKESMDLFKKVLKEKFQGKYQENIVTLAEKVGNLPLAVHIIAKQLLHEKISFSQLPELLNQESPFIANLYQEEKSLYSAVAMTYKTLDNRLKSILVSASVFKGKDFSIESISYINGLSPTSTTRALESLVNLSLLEHSTKKRYRIHPAIREFTRDKLDHPRSSYLQLAAFGLFILFTMWWVYLQLFTEINNRTDSTFSGFYGITALYGGICGFHTSRNWGGVRTLMGKSILFFSSGLILQELGQLIYAYYIYFLHVDLPYPSVGDVFFISTIPFYCVALILLAKASGIDISLHSLKGKLQAIFIPIVMVLSSYVIFLQGYTADLAHPDKIFFDFGYPLGDAIYISLSILTYLLTKNILDGIMKSKALILLFALFVQYTADWTFIYQASRDTWILNGFNDYIYLTSYFIMTMALLNLKSLLVKVHV